MKYLFASFLMIFLAGSFAAGVAWAADDAKHPKNVEWPFDGMTGTVDRQAAQRGLQVYREVCASCHGLDLVAFRTLTGLGFSPAEVKQIASEASVTDGPNEDGEMFDRPGTPADKFQNPYPNEQAARSVNNGAYPPDLSLMVKARPNGGDYLYSLLTGYEEAPADMEMGAGQHYNPYFPGGKIGMPAPLFDGAVSYSDGTEATVEQMSRDVTIFLQWTAEPEMEQRKRMGLKVLIFLAIMTVLFYFAKKRIWARVEH